MATTKLRSYAHQGGIKDPNAQKAIRLVRDTANNAVDDISTLQTRVTSTERFEARLKSLEKAVRLIELRLLDL